MPLKAASSPPSARYAFTTASTRPRSVSSSGACRRNRTNFFSRSSSVAASSYRDRCARGATISDRWIQSGSQLRAPDARGAPGPPERTGKAFVFLRSDTPALRCGRARARKRQRAPIDNRRARPGARARLEAEVSLGRPHHEEGVVHVALVDGRAARALLDHGAGLAHRALHGDLGQLGLLPDL
jgi:hypothetical protein